MFSHITLGTQDIERAIAFYDPVLKTICIERAYKDDSTAGYRAEGAKDAYLWLLPPFDGEIATIGNGSHIAFKAESRQAVREFHAAALAAGGEDEGPPGARPHYHKNYYGAYVRDPDGNKLQAVCHKAE